MKNGLHAGERERGNGCADVETAIDFFPSRSDCPLLDGDGVDAMHPFSNAKLSKCVVQCIHSIFHVYIYSHCTPFQMDFLEKI